MKVAKLIFVSADNHNKFYNMTESNSNINVEFGRVDSTPRTASYPLSQWDKIYNEKIKKGYTDISLYLIENSDNINDIFAGISNSVKLFLKFLIDCAKTKISNNYKISSDNITQGMIDKAQELLYQISNLYNNKIQYSDYNFSNEDIIEFNHLLLELYKIIPRKMDHVKNYLLHDGYPKKVNNILIDEQSLLDTLAGQVKSKPIIIDCSINKNILDDIDTSIELVEDKSISDSVYSLFESNKRYIKNIYKVINNSTEKIFNPNKLKSQLLFHGSRNENWFNIIKTGLLIRPSCAQSTGSMFGNGIYFANKAQKSKGYTSASGSYWAKGNSKKYFLAIYEVAAGNCKDIFKHNSSCYNLNYEKIKAEKFDSVYAHGGVDLKNDEFIIYKTNQCTIRYIVELEE